MANWYTTGAVTIAHNGVTVYGSTMGIDATGWSTSLVTPGALFLAEGNAYEIIEVHPGDQTLKITPPWVGSTVTAASYAILLAPVSSFGLISTVVADPSLTPVDADLFVASGYNTLHDGGGGILVHDSASAATIDSGLVFPAVVGRFIRPVDGIIHTKWFGISPTSTSDQHSLLQNFFNAVMADGYVGFMRSGLNLLRWLSNISKLY